MIHTHLVGDLHCLLRTVKLSCAFNYRNTVKAHYSAHEKIMQIGQNGPLEKINFCDIYETTA